MRKIRRVLNFLLLLVIIHFPESTFSETGGLNYNILDEFNICKTSRTEKKCDEKQVQLNEPNSDNPLLHFGMFFTFIKGV